MLGATVAGQAGTVLTPNSANFETALRPGTNPTTGVYLLDQVDLFNLLCVPGETTGSILSDLDSYCEARRAFLIADSDPSIDSFPKAGERVRERAGKCDPGVNNNTALYFPWVRAPDSLKQDVPAPFPPCGFVAGIYAKIDSSRGVWTAPAGTDAALIWRDRGYRAARRQPGRRLEPGRRQLHPRFSPAMGRSSGAHRTAEGNTQIGSQWKYVPIRRMALYIELSLRRGLQWVVFEPNGARLSAQIRRNVGAFLQTLFGQGAFQGSTPQQAYFVKCDSETTSPADRDNGIVNIVVGFAPLEPAEFVVIAIEQLAGPSAS